MRNIGTKIGRNSRYLYFETSKTRLIVLSKRLVLLKGCINLERLRQFALCVVALQLRMLFVRKLKP